MNELIRSHLAHLRRRNSRPKTITQRRDVLLRTERWFDGRPTLAEMTLQDLERWLDWQSGRVAPSSLHTYVAHLRAFFAWAHDTEHLPANPARMLLGPKVRPATPRPVTQPHLRLALRTATGKLRVMLLLGAYLGLRAGEIAAIRGEDILHEGGIWLIVHGKGGRERVVPIDPALWREIHLFMAIRGPVFPNQQGRCIRSEWVTITISAHFRALGMSYTAHQLRHRAATRLLQHTRNLRQVQDILGHADPRTTAGYTGLTNAGAAAAMGMLAGDLRRDLAPLDVIDGGDEGVLPDPGMRPEAA